MLKAGRTVRLVSRSTRSSAAPGIRICTGTHSGRLTCVQNVIEGRGWRLDVIDLAAPSRWASLGPGVRVKSFTFTPHDELEGYCPLDRERSLIVTSSRRDNITLGVIRPTSPQPSPPVSAEASP